MLTITPISYGQSLFEGRNHTASIMIMFSSDLGIGEVRYGGGFTVACDSSPTPTPPVSQQVHLDPIFPFVIFNDSMNIGNPPYYIPGYDQMPSPSMWWCTLAYKAAANFDNFPLNIGVNLNGSNISITSQQIDLLTEDYRGFQVLKGPQPCTPHDGEDPFLPDAESSACDPLLLDLGLDGIALGPRGVGVHFDNDGDGIMEHSQWVRQGGNEAFLVVDRNGNGAIDNGTELFGNGTVLTLEGDAAPNGFVALAQYDDPRLGGNDDGFITPADAVWSQLALWLDVDANGRSTPDEIMSLASRGIRALPTIPRLRMVQDAAGNIIPYHATALTSSSSRMQMVDVYFRSF